MDVQAFILDVDPLQHGFRLKMEAKRYVDSRYRVQDGFTLIACHGVGQHKEQWEPIIQGLFNAQIHNPRIRIREVWALEWQNHGQSYVLNKDVIRAEDEDAAPLSSWGAAIASFVRSGHVVGHRLIGLGFSAGAAALLLSIKYTAMTLPQPLMGLILLEAPIMDWDTFFSNEGRIGRMLELLGKGPNNRRDVWTCKAEAAAYLRRSFPYKTWDDRILKLYVEHAMHEVTDKFGRRVVQRKSPGAQEGAFPRSFKYLCEAMEQADKVRHHLPIHVILGSGEGIVPECVRDGLIDVKKGRRYESLSRIPDLGHMVMQIDPDAVVRSVSGIMEQFTDAFTSTMVAARL